MKTIVYDSVGPSLIQRVLLVDQYTRSRGHEFVSSSLPGHLIQLMLTGRTHHEANGRQYDLVPGSLIWYHQDELVRGRVIEPVWTFYTLNFIAPALAPPPFESRVREVDIAVQHSFEHLLKVWRQNSVAPAVRQMRVQAGVLELLALIWDMHDPVSGGRESQGLEREPRIKVGMAPAPSSDPSSDLWWRIETWLREDLALPRSLGMIARYMGKSPATIARSSQAAVGQPPMRRLKQIRMSMARGLVMRSDLLLKQVAAQVGYERVHEFSRDYRLAFGVSPRHDRQHAQGDRRPS